MSDGHEIPAAAPSDAAARQRLQLESPVLRRVAKRSRVAPVVEIRSDLEQQATGLRTRIAHIESERAERASADAEEQAVGRELDEVMDGLEAQLALELRGIEGALERLSSGTYGRCETCGEAIDRARLRALPTARRCMACESE